MIFFKFLCVWFFFYLNFISASSGSSSSSSLERIKSDFVFDVSNPLIPVANFVDESKESWEAWLKGAVKDGRDLNSLLLDGNRLIHVAALVNATGLLHALVEVEKLKVNVNLKNLSGCSAYYICYENGFLEMTEYLKSKGCDTFKMDFEEEVNEDEMPGDKTETETETDPIYDETEEDLKLLAEMFNDPIHLNPLLPQEQIEGVRYFEF